MLYDNMLDLLVTVVGASPDTLCYNTLEVVATCCVLLVVAFPFFLVAKVVRSLMG